MHFYQHPDRKRSVVEYGRSGYLVYHSANSPVPHQTRATWQLLDNSKDLVVFILLATTVVGLGFNLCCLTHRGGLDRGHLDTTPHCESAKGLFKSGSSICYICDTIDDPGADQALGKLFKPPMYV